MLRNIRQLCVFTSGWFNNFLTIFWLTCTFDRKQKNLNSYQERWKCLVLQIDPAEWKWIKFPYQTKLNGFGHFPRFFIGSQKLSVVNTDTGQQPDTNWLKFFSSGSSSLSVYLHGISTGEYVVTCVKISDQPGEHVKLIWDQIQVNERILEKKRCPGFCLVAALKLLLEKAEYEKSHLVLNSLQDWVVLLEYWWWEGEWWRGGG